jgi:sulfite exporter TauE/SafE
VPFVLNVDAVAAAFVLGLAGSAHCLGMCGPLIVAARAAGGGAGWRYHGSRLAVYAVLGGAAGWLGHAIAAAGWRRGLAVGAGAVLLAQALGLGAVVWGRAGARIAGVAGRLLAAASAALPRRSAARAAALGALNGLLPCGLVYAALTAAAALGGRAAGAGFMIAFGLGTLPALAVAAYSAAALRRFAPRRLRLLAPVALAIVGAMLVTRGWMEPSGTEHRGHGGGLGGTAAKVHGGH